MPVELIPHSLHGVAKSRTWLRDWTELNSLKFYFCRLLHVGLENPTDRGAWQTTVHRVAKSQTWLKQLTWHTFMFADKSWEVLLTASRGHSHCAYTLHRKCVPESRWVSVRETFAGVSGYNISPTGTCLTGFSWHAHIFAYFSVGWVWLEGEVSVNHCFTPLSSDFLSVETNLSREIKINMILSNSSWTSLLY